MWRSWQLILVVTLSATLPSQVSAANTKRACVAAAEKGQELRDSGRLLAARAPFIHCTAVACPEAVRRQCDEWLADLNSRIPTVVFRARDAAGHDMTDGRVLIDGVLLVPSLDGAERSVDPGAHTFSLESSTGPSPPVRLVVLERDRGRLVEFRGLSAHRDAVPEAAPVTVAVAPAASAAVTGPPAGSAGMPGESGKHVVDQHTGYIVGGVGLATLVGGGFFGVRTFVKKSSADALCPNNKCAGDPRVQALDDDARLSAILSTIGVTVGALTLAGGWLLVRASSDATTRPAARVWVVPTLGGTLLEGRF